MNEEWLPVVGYEGLYAVSELGRVKRTADTHRYEAGTYLALSPTREGYLRVALYKNGVERARKAHDLVLEAFVSPNPHPWPAGGCNHKNGRKDDNRLINLEWVTAQQNMRHAFATGLAKPTRHTDEFKARLSARLRGNKFGAGKCLPGCGCGRHAAERGRVRSCGNRHPYCKVCRPDAASVGPQTAEHVAKRVKKCEPRCTCGRHRRPRAVAPR